MKKILLLLFFVIALTKIFHAQETETNTLVEELIESIAEDSDEEIDYTSLLENLSYFLENKINLNQTTYEELEKLQFLSEFEIHSIISYIKKNGQMMSVYELQLIESLSDKTIENLSYFVKVEEVPKKTNFSLLSSLKYGKNQVFLRSEFYLEESLGYSSIDSLELAENPNARYLGNRLKYYTRYQYTYKDRISWGITAEKDPGEAFGGKYAPKGFDYYSAHFLIKEIGRVKSLAIGDYQLKFGQGLVLWSGMATKKSAYVLNVKRRENGIQKYSSVDENLFMRGVATTVNFGNFDVSAFFSHKNIDANVSLLDTLDDEVQEVSSFQITGFHRIPSEIADRKSISETVYGGNITYRQEKFKLGFTLVNYLFGSELQKDLRTYNLFEFQGTENLNAGLNYQYQINKLSLFGETAMSQNGKMATTNGALISLAPQISLSVLHRYFDPGYQAYYSNAFGETGNTYNESGMYLGTEIHPIKKVKLSAYFDAYRFMWLRSSVSSPSNGSEYFIQADYEATRHFTMYFKLKREIKLENLSNDVSVAKQTAYSDRVQLRYHLSYNVTDELNLKSRFELSKYSDGVNEYKTGFLIYQDVNYQFNNLPLKLNIRYAIFDTQDYDTRIYAYENDILYGFSIPAYYSKGMRTYFNVKYSFSESFEFWFRVAQTYYSEKEIIGSGKDEIPDNKKTQIKLQLRIKF